MVEFNSTSILKKARIGFAVTVFVASAACSHQAIRPANNDSGGAEIADVENSMQSTPTPEPLAAPEAPKAIAKNSRAIKAKHWGKKRKSHATVAKHTRKAKKNQK